MNKVIKSETATTPVADPAVVALQWDECCDVLGGARWEEVLERRRNGLSAEPANSHAIKALLPPARQYLFENGGQCSPLEVFWLKWNLFTMLCRNVQRVHIQQQRPLLILDPARVTIAWSGSAECWLPRRWAFTNVINMPRGAASFAHGDMPPEMAESLFTPPSSSDAGYTAPVLHEWPLGRELDVTALVRSIDRMPDEADKLARGMLRVHVVSDAVAAGEFSNQDVFRLSLPLPGGGHPVRLWARKVDVVERGIVVCGMIDPLSPAHWNELDRENRHVFSNANAAVYRQFDVPCDLYSLGMLLIRLLLVHERQSWTQVQQELAALHRGLNPVVGGIDPSDRALLHRRIAARLKEEGSIFSSSSVVFREDLASSPGPSITDEIWYDALQVALRLMTAMPGFSFWQSAGNTDGKRAGWMAQVLEEVESLRERILVDLFVSPQRNVDIHHACSALRAELVGGGNRRNAH